MASDKVLACHRTPTPDVTASDEVEHTAKRIESFIRDQFLIGDADPKFDRHVNLWEFGYVDSMGVVELVEYLETTFEVTIPEEVLLSTDFAHVNGMARCVLELSQRKRNGDGS